MMWIKDFGFDKNSFRLLIVCSFCPVLQEVCCGNGELNDPPLIYLIKNSVFPRFSNTFSPEPDY